MLCNGMQLYSHEFSFGMISSQVRSGQARSGKVRQGQACSRLAVGAPKAPPPWSSFLNHSYAGHCRFFRPIGHDPHPVPLQPTSTSLSLQPTVHHHVSQCAWPPRHVSKPLYPPSCDRVKQWFKCPDLWSGQVYTHACHQTCCWCHVAQHYLP